jgi:hypothetical protein
VAGSCEYDDEPSGSGATELRHVHRELNTKIVVIHKESNTDVDKPVPSSQKAY